VTYAARLVQALEELAQRLTDAGVRATVDRARLSVPGAWIMPMTAREERLDRGGMVRVSVLLVAPQSSDLEALKTLCGLLDLALEVIDPDEDVDTSVVLPVNDNPLPAFRLVVDLNV
jgi:hypothetical protein